MADDQRLSLYLDHLPAILRQGPFLGQFLLAFEAVFTGGVPLPSAPPPQGQAAWALPEGLDLLLDRVHERLEPAVAPDEFLPWLAQWVATSLRDDWDDQTRRAFLADIVPLYQQRGTRAGMLAVLALSGESAQITEPTTPTTPAHFFQVVVTVHEKNPTLLARTVRRITAIVDREKPAHTFYGLTIQYPGLQIVDGAPPFAQQQDPPVVGVVVGRNTLLGTVTATSF